MCSLNLLARLEEEGIEVRDAVDDPITKVRLCRAAIKPLALVFNGMALAFSLVIGRSCSLFTDAGARLLLLVPFLFLFIGGLLPLLMLSMPARGILEIGRQERELGFSFAEEMASRGCHGHFACQRRLVHRDQQCPRRGVSPRLPQEGHGARGQ